MNPRGPERLVILIVMLLASPWLMGLHCAYRFQAVRELEVGRDAETKRPMMRFAVETVVDPRSSPPRYGPEGAPTYTFELTPDGVRRDETLTLLDRRAAPRLDDVPSELPAWCPDAAWEPTEALVCDAASELVMLRASSGRGAREGGGQCHQHAFELHRLDRSGMRLPAEIHMVGPGASPPFACAARQRQTVVVGGRAAPIRIDNAGHAHRMDVDHGAAVDVVSLGDGSWAILWSRAIEDSSRSERILSLHDNHGIERAHRVLELANPAIVPVGEGLIVAGVDGRDARLTHLDAEGVVQWEKVIDADAPVP